MPQASVMHILLDVLREQDAQAAVTLVCGGTLVTGTMVGSYDFLDSLSKRSWQSGSPFGVSLAGGLAKAITQLKDAQLVIRENAQENDERADEEFWYLIDAHVVVEGRLVPNGPGIEWCCPVSSIDAVTLGKLGI